MPPALSLSGIGKSFDTVVVLEGASIDIRRGEVHAVLGENGAGKSSLMNIAAGIYSPDAGTIRVDGRVVRMSTPRQARALGIGMVHQHFKLVPTFSVAQNVLLDSPRKAYRRGLRLVEEEIAAQCADLGIGIDPSARIADLSVAEKQQVELAKVLVSGASIVIFDEPTALLSDDEAERFLRRMRRLADRGCAVVLVTHRMAEVTGYCDRVTVMRGGATLASLDAKSMGAEELTRLAVGVSETLEPRRVRPPAGEHRLNVGALCFVDPSTAALKVNEVSFYVRSGEVYGIAGIAGNGQTELADMLSGLARADSGEIWLEGSGDVSAWSAGRRKQCGIAYVPADRYAKALAGDLNVMVNYAVPRLPLGRYGPPLQVDHREIRSDTLRATIEYEIKGADNPGRSVALLSGGNAQKLVVARELANRPKLMICHSPTRGLDVLAKVRVQEAILAARDAGGAVVLISEDLDEVLQLSDRIGVMKKGRLASEFAAPVDRLSLGRAMV